MVDPDRLEQEISQLEGRLSQLREERELVQKRTEVLEELRGTIDATLKANGLGVTDLLELYRKDVDRLAAAPRKRKAQRKRTRGGSSTKTRIRIKGLGEFALASRGKLPETLKQYMDENGLDRNGLIEKHAVGK